MKTVAVIAEYNPFHNGHKYQLENIRKKHNADKIIIVMSGDFCQRGIPAIFDKYTRTRMALENGADLVIELPVYFALGSAEYFAQGAVSLIDKLGIVNEINFGSEESDIDKLYQCAQILSKENEEYKSILGEALKSGKSFPEARNIAVQNQNIDSNIDFDNILSNPNNILGIEYIKAYIQRTNKKLNHSNLKFTNITRQGSGYNSSKIVKGEFASANALREALKYSPKNNDNLAEYVPESVFNFLNHDSIKTTFLDDFSETVKYKLISDFGSKITGINPNTIYDYYDVTPNLINTFGNNIYNYTTLSEFINICKSKNMTYTRISRCLFHILLNLKQSTIDVLKENDYCQYARILGFNENGKDLLKAIKQNSQIPIITKLTKALKSLDEIAKQSIEADIIASTIYQSIQNKQQHMANEFTRGIVKI